MQRQGIRRRFGVRWFMAGICVAGVCLATAGPLEAAGSKTLSNSKGLTLSVDAQWIESGGYRPVRISVSAAKPSPADRNFHVEFRPATPYNNRTIVVSQDFELPAGGADAAITLYVPQYFAWLYYDLDIWEDGRYLKPLSQERISLGSGQDWAEALPNVLLVADKPAVAPTPPVLPPGIPSMSTVTATANPATATLASLLPSVNSQTGYVSAAAAQGVPTALDSSITLPLDELPQSWLGYSGLDIVCLTLGQAKQMAAEEPARWSALRAWVAAGGNLMVAGVASDAPQLAELERLLGESRTGGLNGAAARGWKKPAPESFKQPLLPPFGASNFNGGVPGNTVMSGMAGGPGMAPGGGMPVGAAPAPAVQPQPAQAQPAPAPVHDPPFVYRAHGLGLVVAVATDDLLAQSAEQWQGLLNTIGVLRWVWYRRHGMSAQRENRDFWNWPVPGVGLAPVTAFQVMITAFVIAIGPLNYWWLRRRGKLHLLVMVVPLSAALVTLALFGYALAVDGLGVRVRTRSITRLDQRTGEAACWARIAYYAGLSPSGGLRFSDDVAALPLLPQSQDERHGELRRRTMSWTPEGQRLVSGWIVSRTPTQFLTVRSRRSALSLNVKSGKGGSPPRIENRLGVRVERLLLADADGNHYRAGEIAIEGTATAERADLDAESNAFRKLYDLRRPQVPAGFDGQRSRLVSTRRWRWTSPWNNSLPQATLTSSLLERELESALIGFSRTQGSQRIGLQPRTYVAIVERSPEVEYGVDSYQEEESLHVVVGRW